MPCQDGAHEVDLLLAEMDVYETFAEKHCEGRTRSITLCNGLPPPLPPLPLPSPLTPPPLSPHSPSLPLLLLPLLHLLLLLPLFPSRASGARGRDEGRVCEARRWQRRGARRERPLRAVQAPLLVPLRLLPCSGRGGGASTNVSLAFDLFLGELGATLSASMRHLAAPSTADGAYHFYQKISFHIYLITQQVPPHPPTPPQPLPLPFSPT